MKFVFRPIDRGDFEVIHRWFNAPHARPWFGNGCTLEEIVEDYTPSIERGFPTCAFIAMLDDKAVGLVEWCRFRDHLDVAQFYGVEDPGAANIDVILGEGAHHGVGPQMIRAFLAQVVFEEPDITTCIIDPVPENVIAIRAYEKAGFRFLRAMPEDGEGNGIHLLEMKRADLSKPVVEDAVVIRPGRIEDLPIGIEIDEDAVEAYRAIGLPFDFTDDHPFAKMERARWERCTLLFAWTEGKPVGFMALGHADGKPHLEQLSVRRAYMRRGIGTKLLERAIAWSVRAGELWITTYDHVPWNAPWYARHGFVAVEEKDAPAEIRAVLESARTAVPQSEHQIAMVRRRSSSSLPTREDRASSRAARS